MRRPVPPAQEPSPQWLNLVSSESVAIRQFTIQLSPVQVAAATTAEETFTSLVDYSTSKPISINSEDIVLMVTKPTAQAGLFIGGFRVPADDQLAITFGNTTASPVTPTTSEVYTITLIKNRS